MNINLYWGYLKILTYNIITLWIVERLRLIENFTIQVPNLIRHQKAKTFWSMFLSFLRKWSFNLCLKILSKFANFRSVSKNCSKLLVSDTTNFFEQNTCFLKKSKSIKTKVLTKSFRDGGSQLTFSKCFAPIWLLLSS